MILCCGEALIDMLPVETASDTPALAPHPGGAVFNTAVALGRLGAPVGFFSGVSTDFLGQMLDRQLAVSGVGTGLCVRSPRPTTLAFVQLIDGQARYTFYDEGTAGRMLTTTDLPALPTTIQALFFGGISLVAEPCGTAYEALMLRAARDRVTMLDPNIRPGFITDLPCYRARLARMIAAADIVKLSDEDLEWISRSGQSGRPGHGPAGIWPQAGADHRRRTWGACVYSRAPSFLPGTEGRGRRYGRGGRHVQRRRIGCAAPLRCPDQDRAYDR